MHERDTKTHRLKKSSEKSEKINKFLLFSVSLWLIFFSLSCASVPILERPECTAARTTTKEFYSYHFGNEMKFSPENLKPREKFLTAEFVKTLPNAPSDADVFTTNNTDYPKAFRIGGCQLVDPSKANVEVLLFWKTDTRTEQKAISVEVVKQTEKWLINKISN